MEISGESFRAAVASLAAAYLPGVSLEEAAAPPLEPFAGEKLREGERVTGIWVDRVQRRRTHGAVIGVADPEPDVVPLR